MGAKLSSKQRAFLLSAANSQKAVVQIGKDGLTPEVTASVDEALAARELIKINVQKSCLEDPRETAEVLSQRTHSAVVRTIGRKIILYRRAHDAKDRMELPQ